MMIEATFNEVLLLEDEVICDVAALFAAMMVRSESGGGAVAGTAMHCTLPSEERTTETRIAEVEDEEGATLEEPGICGGGKEKKSVVRILTAEFSAGQNAVYCCCKQGLNINAMF